MIFQKISDKTCLPSAKKPRDYIKRNFCFNPQKALINSIHIFDTPWIHKNKILKFRRDLAKPLPP